jgi:hypothetical protein
MTMPFVIIPSRAQALKDVAQAQADERAAA